MAKGWFSRLFGSGEKPSKHIPITQQLKAPMAAPVSNETSPAQLNSTTPNPNFNITAAENGKTAAAPSADSAAPSDIVDPPSDHDDVASEWSVGDVILDLYEVKQIFEGGAMGRVYRVHHRAWNRDLAVKSPRPDYFKTEQQKQNFAKEAETWVSLGLHPHIVSCSYVRRLGGIPRVFAEYVEGGSLKDWIDDLRLYEGGPDKALERILDIAIQFAWGLQYAHEQGLIHQDVKPANVLMKPKGTAKVSDFGLANARAVSGEIQPKADHARSMLATFGGRTPAYCSPEQAELAAGSELGRRSKSMPKLTKRTDIWSWAVSVLEMFTSEVTWTGGQIADSALAGYLESGSDSDALPKMPPAMGELLGCCLRQNPNDRPNGFTEVASGLQQIYRNVLGKVYPRSAPKPAELLADGLNNQAISLLDLGKADEARRLWEMALQRDSSHPQATYNQGLSLWRNAKITDEELLRRLRTAGTNRPEDWIIPYLSGWVHLERGDVEAARESLDTAVRASGGVEAEGALKQANSRLTGCVRCLKSFGKDVDFVVLGADGSMAACIDTITSKDPALKNFQYRNALSVWNIATGTCENTYQGHTFQIESVALSSDGQWLLSGGGGSCHDEDFSMRLWACASGQCVKTFDGHSKRISSVKFSTNGRQALSGGFDSTLRLWDLNLGKCLKTFIDDWLVSSVAISPDGHLVLSGDSHGLITLWDVAAGRSVRTFKGHTSWVKSLVFSADGRRILSAGGEGQDASSLRWWDVETGRCIWTNQTGDSRYGMSVAQIALTGDGRWALSGGKAARLWDTHNGRCVRTFENYTKGDISQDGRMALLVNHDGMHEWNINAITSAQNIVQAPSAPSRTTAAEESLQSDTNFERILNEARDAIRAGDWTPALSFIGNAQRLPQRAMAAGILALKTEAGRACRRTGLFQVWCKRTIKAHALPISTAVLSADGRWALSGTGGEFISKDHELVLWDAASLERVRIFPGHTRIVTSICISENGNYAVSGSEDFTARVWNVATGQCLRTIESHKYSVGAVALSPDGRWLASGGKDGLVYISEVDTGRCIKIYKGNMGQIDAIAWSAKGCLLLTGSGHNYDRKESGTLRTWDVQIGRCIRMFGGLTDSVQAIAISADERWLVSGGKQLQLWELATGQCLRELKGHSNEINSVAIGADGRWAISVGADATMRVWDLETGTCIRVIETKTEITSVSLSPDGRTALTGSADGELQLWELDWDYEFPGWADWDDGAKPYLENYLSLHTPYAASLPESALKDEQIQLCMTRRGLPSWSEDNLKSLLSTLCHAGFGWLRADGVKRELEKAVDNYRYVQVLTKELWNKVRDASRDHNWESAAALLGQARRTSNSEITTEDQDVVLKINQYCRRRNLVSASFERTFEGHTGPVCSVAISADGNRALTGGLDKTLRLWDIINGTCIKTFGSPRGGLNAVGFGTEGRLTISGSEDHLLQLWDANNGSCIWTFKGHSDIVTSLSINDSWALSGSADKTIRLWELLTGQCIRTYMGHAKKVNSVYISGDGRLALSGSEDKTLRLWELASGNCVNIFKGHKGSIQSVVMSADGCFALSGSSDKSLRLWDIAKKSCIRTFDGHSDRVNSVALSADGKMALSGSNDRTVRLWDVATGSCIKVLDFHKDHVQAVTFSSDGLYIFSVSKDKTLRSYVLTFDYEFPGWADWDDRARPHMLNFLTLHTPYAGSLPMDRQPTDEEVCQALTRTGKPTWSEDDFQYLLVTLGHAGYGWLRPEGVKRELEKMAKDWNDPPPLLC